MFNEKSSTITCYFVDFATDSMMFLTCNHNYAWVYYIVSLLDEKETFYSFLCPPDAVEYNEVYCTQATEVSMGYKSIVTATPQDYGVYYVAVNATLPFSLNCNSL